MSDDLSFKITGLDEIQKNLESLADETQTKIVRDAVRAGAQVVQKEIVQRSPKRTGLLSKHFDIRTKKQKGGTPDAVSALIGPNSKEVIHPQDKGKTKGMKRTALKITSFFEFGKLKHPFMTQAWEASKTRALDAMIDKLRAGLAKWGLK